MSNYVDPDEVARYNAAAATWWQEDGPMWPLHKLNGLRAPYVTEQICRHLVIAPEQADALRGVKVLDIGCGAGLLSEALAARGASVVGVDPAERNIAIARTHAASTGLAVDYRVGSIDALATSEEFDVVLNMEVVEHVVDLPDFLSRCCAHVRPGGLHFVATINRTIVSWMVAIIGAEYILRWLPQGTHQWRRFVSPREVESLLTLHDQQILNRTGVSINPITRHYRLADYLGVNYMLTARRLLGK